MSRTRPAWVSLAERGSEGALRLAAAVHRAFGRRAVRALLQPIAAYYTVAAPRARRASLEYQAALRATAGPGAAARRPTAADAFRHFHAFAVNLFDRMAVWGDGIERVHFSHRGSEHLFRLAREKRGGILLGSHLGSFDMMRLLAGRYGVVVNVLMHTRHGERITSFFERQGSGAAVRVIALEPGSTRTAFEIRDCLARGEFVGILADRVPPGVAERTERVPFLGRPANFSLRPFLLAGLLGRPLLFAMCLRRGEDAYEAVVEPLAEPEAPLPRAEREARARAWLAAYVARLEHYCREEPLQWFNFYPFWAPGEADA